jgi:anti-anti-sigma regulatory factor
MEKFKFKEKQGNLYYRFPGSVEYYKDYKEFAKIENAIALFDPETIVVDLTEATDINAQAVGFFMNLKTTCKKSNIVLEMRVSPEVSKVLKLQKLLDFFEIQESNAEI